MVIDARGRVTALLSFFSSFFGFSCLFWYIFFGNSLLTPRVMVRRGVTVRSGLFWRPSPISLFSLVRFYAFTAVYLLDLEL